jgi:hypothetical protein
MDFSSIVFETRQPQSAARQHAGGTGEAQE